MPSNKLIVALAAAVWTGSLVAQEQPPALQPAGRPPAAEPELIPPALAGDAPRTAAPATRPSAAELRKKIPQLFADLANADPAVRENARVSLMGVSRLDLPVLETLVRNNLPLVPAQAVVIKEIITHVYLSGEEYPVSRNQGFLGVLLMQVSIVSKQDEPAVHIAEDDNPFDPRRLPPMGTPTTGVLILERMPGFCGARSLLDGDVVLGVIERPDEPIRDTQGMRIVVTSFTAGDTIHFQVLRQGQVVKVPITLDTLPEAAEDASGFQMRGLLEARKVLANEYWERNFAPMLKESAG